MKKLRLFIQNPDACEPWAYCGDIDKPDDVQKAIHTFVDNEMDMAFFSHPPFMQETLNISVMIKPMTDKEIADLPEL